MRISVKEPLTLYQVVDWFSTFQKTGNSVEAVRMPKKVYSRVQKVCRELIFEQNYIFGAKLVKDNSLPKDEVEIAGYF